MRKSAVAAPLRVRCAIYTRKSTDEGLDQAFNSLHAQREACEAYIRSQAGEGWWPSPVQYDDGGFSGGNMERPGLARLLADVDAGRIDTVVVYKVDRLTRALGDFAKIVDRLDAAKASFVSVTQSFNTTTSMGRLTLNVLLSFAQFEREVTGERIRDKIAASKAKGMWMGGCLPLGYDAPTDPQTRSLLVNEREADVVRRIFQAYLELGSVHALSQQLDVEGVRSKVQVFKSGRQRGGGRFGRGQLFYLLKNRTYLGEIIHGEKSYPGSHPPIIDAELFANVQAMLGAQRGVWTERPARSATMPLKGIIFDADGHPMSPTFTHRGARSYRYYTSAPLQRGEDVAANPRAVRRLAADEIEGVLQHRLAELHGVTGEAMLKDLLKSVRRIDVEVDGLRLTYAIDTAPRAVLAKSSPAGDGIAWLDIPVCVRRRGGRATISEPMGSSRRHLVQRDMDLIGALQRGHDVARAMGWNPADGSMRDGAVSAPPNSYDRKLCCLAFLAPDIQRLIMEGRQPPGMTIATLLDQPLPTSWPEQRRRFGLEHFDR